MRGGQEESERKGGIFRASIPQRESRETFDTQISNTIIIILIGKGKWKKRVPWEGGSRGQRDEIGNDKRRATG